MVAQVLGHRDIKFPDRRSITGRLLYWNHLEDQISYILCPPEGPDLDSFVYRAGLPVKLPPGINIDELPTIDPLPLSFTKPLARHDPTPMAARDPIDLDPSQDDSRNATVDERSSLPSSFDRSLQEKEASDDHDHEPRNENDDDADDDVLVEYSLGELHSPLLGTNARNQGVSHVPVSADQVLRSEGNERRKWIGACKKELDNLTSTQTIEPISADDLTRVTRLRRTARSTGNKLIELPAKGVFTIKPDKYKVRFVACGNKELPKLTAKSPQRTLTPA